MNRIVRNIFAVFFVLACLQTHAQNKVQLASGDSVVVFDGQAETPESVEAPKKHNPQKATMYSAVLPGLGQIYNKQYLKVPFIYAGFGGIAYTINRFHQQYLAYKQAVYDLRDLDPSTNSYNKYLPEDQQIASETGNIAAAENTLITSIGNQRDTRDKVIIVAAAFYLLNILDASVNAHFIDFDISPDLSINIQPVGTDVYSNNPIFGAKLCYTF